MTDRSSLKEITEKDVKSYYAKGPRFSTAACTAKEHNRYCGDVGQIMEQIHPEVLARYYGCGIVAPDVLHGLDIMDLGCGVGVDCFVLSRLVGQVGHVIGVDMTQEQLDVANKYRVYHSNCFGYSRPNTLFVKANIEDLKQAGLMDASKDLVVSNCVVSLSIDKDATFSEASRVLKPGGELYFSDMYCNKVVPEEIQKDQVLWGEGFGGALRYEDLCEIAQKVGFCEPILYETEQLDYHDDAILERIPDDLEYKAATFRLFRKPDYPVNKNSKMKITYYGGIQNALLQFCLTSKIRLRRGQSMLVSRELGEALKLSRYSKFLGFEIYRDTQDGSKLPAISTSDPFAVVEDDHEEDDLDDPFVIEEEKEGEINNED